MVAALYKWPDVVDESILFVFVRRGDLGEARWLDDGGGSVSLGADDEDVADGWRLSERRFDGCGVDLAAVG